MDLCRSDAADDDSRDQTPCPHARRAVAKTAMRQPLRVYAPPPPEPGPARFVGAGALPTKPTRAQGDKGCEEYDSTIRYACAVGATSSVVRVRTRSQSMFRMLDRTIMEPFTHLRVMSSPLCAAALGTRVAILGRPTLVTPSIRSCPRVGTRLVDRVPRASREQTGAATFALARRSTIACAGRKRACLSVDAEPRTYHGTAAHDETQSVTASTDSSRRTVCARSVRPFGPAWRRLGSAHQRPRSTRMRSRSASYGRNGRSAQRPSRAGPSRCPRPRLITRWSNHLTRDRACATFTAHIASPQQARGGRRCSKSGSKRCE